MKHWERNSPNLRGTLLCMAACYIVIGAVLLLFPQMSLVSICSGIGIAAIILGLISVAVYFIRQGYLAENNIGFAGGMATALMGLYAVLQTDRFAVAFTQVLAFCMIADGIVKLQFSMDLLRLKGRLWWLLLLAALAGTGLAMAILLYPFESVEAKNFYTYIVLITDGVLNAAAVFWLSWQRKRFGREEELSEREE